MPQNKGKASKSIRSLTALVGLSMILLGSNVLLGSNSSMSATPITQADIPLTINQPGRYVVTEHLSMGQSNGRAAIWIEADDVHLDLNGFALSGPLRSVDQCFTGEVGVGILVFGTEDDPAEGVHITNGTVRGFREGIHLFRAKANRLRGLTVTQTCFWGVRVGGGTDHDVSRNNISGNLGTGVLLASSNNNRLTKNIVNGNVAMAPEDEDRDHAGFLLQSSHGNVIAMNDISGNGINTYGHGVSLVESDNNTIRANGLHRNAGNGIDLQASNHNTIHDNLVSASGYSGIFLGGFSFLSSTGNLIQANLAYGNRTGIQVSGDPYENYENTFKRNIALRNITDLADFSRALVCPNVWTNNTFVTKIGNIACIE